MGKWKANIRSIMTLFGDNSAESKDRVKKIIAFNMNARSRPIVFRDAYRTIYDELRGKLFSCGHRAHHGGWVGGTRKQARKLAREMARHEIRMGKT